MKEPRHTRSRSLLFGHAFDDFARHPHGAGRQSARMNSSTSIAFLHQIVAEEFHAPGVAAVGQPGDERRLRRVHAVAFHQRGLDLRPR